MALMFQRLARNFIKNGYFPTDGATVSGVLGKLQLSGDHTTRIFDPCCGEGTALAEIKHALGSDEKVIAEGIEYDQERSNHSETLLNNVIFSDINDCVIGKNQYGLLFLNPPYGDCFSNNAVDHEGGSERLEKRFFDLTIHSLIINGILVFIVPHYIVKKSLGNMLAARFTDLRIFKAMDTQFKQVVIIGKKKHYSKTGTQGTVEYILNAVNDYENMETIDKGECVYDVPKIDKDDVILKTVRPTTKQIKEVINTHPCLWRNWNTVFSSINTVRRNPARKLSNWHLALTLAAGQVSGMVTNKAGRTVLVKGSTHKEKSVTTHSVETEEGFEETRTLTDIFVPVVKGIDLTEGAPSYGNILTIK